jgi:hypothetical protein
MDYATTDNPNGKYKEGTVIDVTGAAIKASNGRFVISHPFQPQPNEDSYHTLIRLDRNGHPLESHVARNCRGHRGSWLDKHAKILEGFTPRTIEKKVPPKGIKFLWNGIRVDGKLMPAHYGDHEMINDKLPRGTITIYARSCLSRLPRLDDCEFENNTDIQSDYFESDRLRIPPTSRYYAEAKTALEAAHIHDEKRAAKREAR